MKTRDINRIVDSAYSALYPLNNIKWTAYRDRCAAMAESEERDHRRGKPDSVTLPKGASVKAAARLFVVKRIAESMAGVGHQPTIADVISYQSSAIYAASLVANYRDVIAEAWKDQDYASLASLDYCEFINDGKKP